MTGDPKPIDQNEGEAHLKKKERKQIIFVLATTLLGGIIGFSMMFFNQSAESALIDEFTNLSLNPILSVAIAAGFVLGLLILPLWTLRIVDELERSNNYIGATAGCYAGLTAFPVWATLHAGGLVPEVNAFGIWLVTFVATMVAYCYARFRP